MRSRLIVRCPDEPGIVAAIANHLLWRGANIVSSAQHSGEQLFLRMESPCSPARCAGTSRTASWLTGPAPSCSDRLDA